MPKKSFNTSTLMIDQLEAISRVSTLIASTNVESLGRELAKELHALTRAETVIFIARRAVPSMSDVIYAFPSEREAMFSETEQALFLICNDLGPGHGLENTSSHEEAIHALLSRVSVRAWLRFPLYIGGVLIGVLLLLDLPKSCRIDTTTQIVSVLSSILALALRNGVVYQQVEKRSTKALLESEERFSKAFHANPAPLFITELDTGRYINVNDECLRMQGYTREQMIGHTSWELGVWVDKTIRAKAIAKLRVTGSFRNEPVQFRISNGEIKDVLWSAEIITLNGKEVMLSLLIDVTERMKTEKALRESEERFSKAFSANPAPLAISELDSGRFIDVNEECLQMLNYSREEMVGHTSWELGIWVDPKVRKRVLTELIATGSFRNESTQFRIKDGVIKDVLWSAEVITLNGKHVMLSLLIDITARMKTEKALLESEERFSKAFSANPAPLVITDIEQGRFLDVNEKWANMLGYKREEMVGHISKDLGIWADPAARDKAVAKLKTMGRFEEEPVCFLTKSGGIRNVLWSAEIITLNKQNVMLSLILDYTERKRAEDAAQETELRYQRLMENLSSGVVVFDTNLNIVFANTMAASLFGLTPEQMLQKTGYDSDWGFLREDGTSVQPDDYPIRKVLSSAITIKSIMVGIAHGDNKPIWELCNMYPVCNANGNIIQAVAMFNDITERKRAEEALRESEERFSKAFHSNPAPLVISEIDTGRFIDFNEKWLQMLGYTREEMIGRTSNEVGIWVGMDTRDTAIAKLRSSGYFRDEPVRFLTKSGEIRNAFWSAEAITLNGKNVMLSLILDYTERKRAEDALEKRVIALTAPFEDTGEIEFEDLFDLAEIQRIQDAFANATNVASIIVKKDGMPVTKPSNFRRLCMDIIRKTDKGLANCERSNANIWRCSPDGPIVHLCLSGGLWDAGASIMVGGRHIASWLIGQVRNNTQTEEEVLAYAREIGADEQTFLEAFREVPVMSHERFEQIAQSLNTLAKQISTTAYQNVQQARFISDRKRAEEALRIIAESGVAPGEDIFRSLVKQLAISQGKHHALLARIDESELIMAHTIAVWSNGQFCENFSYCLKGTPCFDTMAKGVCFYPCDAQRQFPHNKLLVKLNVESYWGVLLHSSEGKIMGLLAVMDDRPMEENPQIFSLLNSFAVRAASELERRRIEEKYQTLFNEMLDGFAVHEIICDEAGTPVDYRYLAVNPAFERMTGQRAEWIIGKTMQEVLPQKENLWVERFGRVALTGEPTHFEEYSETLDRYYELSAFQPQPRQFACIVVDITDRKQAETERQALEQRYHALVDNLPIGVFRTSPEVGGRFLMVNAALVKMCGFDSADALLNTRVTDLYVDPNQRGLFSAELLEKGTITAREAMLQRADGSHFWAAISCQVFYNQTSELECFDGSVIDITERKNAEEALRENERRLSYALSATSDAVWEWNCVTQTVYYSPRWYEMLGYDPLEYAMNFTTWEALCHPDDFANTVERIHSVLEYQKDQGYETEFRMRHKNGSWVWILGRGNVVERSTTGTPLLLSGTNTDISERKRAEEERARLEDQLLQAQKMEAVGQLAGGIAHDFNNLLQVILGHLDLLTSEDGEKREEVQVVRLAAERVADLTRQLLAFSRRQIIQPVNLDLNDLIESVLKMVRRVIGEHIELHFLPGNRLGTIHADEGQVEQVIMNLCVNARDAMPGGGSLTIETENVVIGDAFCRDHLWATEGRYVLLSVTDTGHGMDEATRTQIFEPFFTTKGVGQGTGLGLATVHGIVKQHNGLLYVYSEVGKGTVFKIYFPIVEQPVEKVGTKNEVPVVGGTETILVAEDEEGVRGLVCRMLQSGGYTVLPASNGEEALRVFEEHANEIDLALLDVMMPKLGGREVMEYISAKCPWIRFLFSSGYSESAIHTNFVIKKGIHLISKPYSKLELLRAVREILDGNAL